ncbi:protein FAM200A-like [Octopus bimaculoides]|uniref:protein FAM200A-like n=1 Tax=Octopus bimaculoides TaxID=37653 RepID=UPI00071E24A8|nr:protein FAM200A-like [Octopus bimaculoides]|eukprot:XP_014774364.1 PREDICTED: protein FAM200A-like [Octopus bimaculoides]
MTGCIEGTVSFVEKEDPNLFCTHCFLHQDVLVSKISQENLMVVLHKVIGVVNYIKSKLLKPKLFEQVCKEMDYQLIKLLMHTEVRWLSIGKVPNRVHELHKKLLTFFLQEKQETFCE